MQFRFFLITKNYNNCQCLEYGTHIRAHVKVTPLVTHPARVVNSEYSSVRPIFALSSTPTINPIGLFDIFFNICCHRGNAATHVFSVCYE
jgi:hypothetical protein